MEITSLLMLLATWAAAPHVVHGRVLRTARASAPTVDLGYATCQGYHDDTFGLNVWKGYVDTSFLPGLTVTDNERFLSVRYAAPPVGSLRWQAPRPPTGNGSLVMAVDTSPLCAHRREDMACLRSMDSIPLPVTRIASS